MQTTKLLLVYPAVRFENRLRYYMTDFSCAEAPGAFVFPPLEMLYVASLARENNIAVRLIDAASRRKPPEWTIQQCINETPTHLLFPAPLGELFFSVFDIINVLFQKIPGVKIAVFGPEVTMAPELALNYDSVDVVIIGEPDNACVNWVLGNKKADNLVFRDSSKTAELVPFNDLDALPHPARDLINPRRYYAPFSRRGPYTTVWGSRGCVHGQCLFCSSSLWRPPKTYIHHSPEYIIEEFSQAGRLGYKEVFFRDQTFTGDYEWAETICIELLKNKIKMLWRCMTRVDCADYELFKLMKRAGCYQISFGFESPEQKVLDENRKGIKIEDAFIAARDAKKAGLEVVGNFLIGLKGESRDAVFGIHDFARQLGCDFAQFHAVLPVPDKNKKSICPPVNDTEKKVIKRAQRLAYLKFYLTPGFLVRRTFMLLDPRMLSATLKAAWNIVRYGM